MSLNIKKLNNLYKSQLLTQEDLALKAGLSKQSISSILKGNNDPQLSTLEKIATALNIPLIDLFTSEGTLSNNGCTMCATKDKIIADQARTIEDLRFLVDSLKLTKDILERQIELINGKR